MGDVAGHMGRADAVGAQPRLLDIDRPHLGALGVIEHRQVDRSGQVILGEFAGAAHIDDLVEGRQGGGVGGFQDLKRLHVRSGFRRRSVVMLPDLAIAAFCGRDYARGVGES